MKPKLQWNWDGEKFHLKVPIEMWKSVNGRGIGEYDITIHHRPSYCDRGDWVILVDGYNDVDFADGFPRYVFGSINDVLWQAEAWINRREAYRNTL